MSARLDVVLATKREIQEAGYRVRQPSPYHLKSGRVNFYPSTGKLFIDGIAGTETDVDIDVCMRFLAEYGTRDTPVPTRPPATSLR